MLGLEGDDGEAAEGGGRSAGGAEGPVRLEGIADRGDLGCLGGGEQRAEDAGEEVSVLVRVDVGDPKAGGLEAAYLCRRFGGDFGWADAAHEEIADEVGEGVAKSAAIGAKGRDLRWGQGRRAVDEEDVAANFEGGVGEGAGDGVVEECAGGHEGGGGERAGAVEFGDGAIDAGGEAEVVGVNEEGHGSGYRVQGTGCRVQNADTGHGPQVSGTADGGQ